MEVKIFDYLPDEAHYIRDTVFIKEQGFEKEYDEIDNIAKHIVIYENGEALGTCRVFYDETEQGYHVGRIAVLKEHRGKSLGRLLLSETEKLVKALGGDVLRLGGQLRVAAFYEKLGFKKYGEIYLDEGCEHVPFVKELIEN